MAREKKKVNLFLIYSQTYERRIKQKWKVLVPLPSKHTMKDKNFAPIVQNIDKEGI